MPRTKRRTFLYLVAAAVGAAAGIREIEKGVDVGVGEPKGFIAGGGGESGPGPTPTPTGVDEFEVAFAGDLASIPEPSVKPQLVFVGGTRDWGVHVNYDDAKPIHKSSDDGTFEIAIADSLADVNDPASYPQFIFIDGNTRDWGVHVNDNGQTGVFTDDFEFAIESKLGDVVAASVFPQVSFIIGDHQTRGIHVDES